MKTIVKGLIAGAIGLGIAGCDVDQTKEGEMPDVDINASGGQLPEFNVEGPEVSVGTENTVVQTPTVDVDLPGDDEGAEKK